MKFGLHFGSRGVAGDPGTLRAIAQKAEALGYEHFGMSDQAIIDDVGRFRERGLEHFLIGGDGSDVQGTIDRLEHFVQPFTAALDGPEQQRHVTEYVTGLLSDLEHKTSEGIAYLHDQERQGIQKFIGFKRSRLRTIRVEDAFPRCRSSVWIRGLRHCPKMRGPRLRCGTVKRARWWSRP